MGSIMESFLFYKQCLFYCVREHRGFYGNLMSSVAFICREFGAPFALAIQLYFTYGMLSVLTC